MIKERGKKFKPWVVMGLMMVISYNSYSQSGGFCKFDENYEAMINKGSYQTFQQNVETIIESMNSNPQAIMNNVVYTVPIVFHVIHLGEQEGSGSNVSDSLIVVALQHLNADFRNTALNGHDVEINFCLAQQDPEGCPTDGINRVNGISVPGYLQNGINSTNDIDVKALSIWPNDTYINIWIVHDIASSPGSQIKGYATFPNTPSNADGIVLYADIVGSSSDSHLLTHEMGHFFNLYHTFHDTELTDCSNLGNCHQQGDMICETRAHIEIVSAPCNELQFQSCDQTYNLPYLVSENYMNYTINSCRDEFVPEQIMWIRAALMNLRTSLMNSTGCSLGCCNSINASFNILGANNEYPVNSNVTIYNTSTGSSNFKWYIDYEEVIPATTNLTHLFNSGGVYTICLDAFGSDNCVDRYCEEIYIIPVCDPENECGVVQNSNFEDIDGIAMSGYISFDSDVCGWKRIQSTPYYCNNDYGGSVALWLEDGDIERISTKEPLVLEEGKEYTICIKYWVTCKENEDDCTVPNLIVALADNNDKKENAVTGDLLESNAFILANIKPITIDALGQNNHNCHVSEPAYHMYTGTFFAPDPTLRYLTITGEPGNEVSITFIDDVYIHDETENCCFHGNDDCITVPDFTYELEECKVTFNGTFTGDPGTFYWNFDDGASETGVTVTHEFIHGDTVNVCLTIQCDFENSYTICKEIIIPEECNKCEGNVINIPSIQCNEEGSTTNSYLADFDIIVIKGYKPCGEDFYAGSDDVAITSPSYMINTTNPAFDIISVSLVITPPSGYDLNTTPATGYITLCGEGGKMICYEFNLTGASCSTCEELDQVIATCDILLSNDSTFIYTDTIPLPNLPIATFSETPGLVLGTPTGGGIPFTITTTQAGTFNSSTVLVYDDGLGNTICFKLNIVVENACPIGCIPISEDVLTLMCEEEMIGENTEFIIHDFEFPRGYGPCRGSITGSIGGDGSVSISSGSSLDVYNISIQMPPSYSMTEVYTVTFILCDEEGNEYEFCLDVVFMCGTGDRIANNTKEDFILEKYEVFPNPANTSITLSNIGLKLDNVNYTYQLFDITGRKLLDRQIKSKSETIDISNYVDGLYLIKVFREDVGILSKTISIIKK